MGCGASCWQSKVKAQNITFQVQLKFYIDNNYVDELKQWIQELQQAIDYNKEIIESIIATIQKVQMNALCYALTLGRQEIFEYLYEEQDANFSTLFKTFQKLNKTPLDIVCENGHLEFLQYFFPIYLEKLNDSEVQLEINEKQIQVNVGDLANNYNAIQRAIYNCHLDIVIWLHYYFQDTPHIKEADLFMIDETSGDNSALISIRTGNLKIVKFLQICNCDFKHKNKRGENALIIAAISARMNPNINYLPCVKYLIQNLKLDISSCYDELVEICQSQEILNYIKTKQNQANPSSKSYIVQLTIIKMSYILKNLAICGFYGLSSVSLSFVNKLLFQLYDFKYPIIVNFIKLLLLQFVANIIITPYIIHLFNPKMQIQLESFIKTPSLNFATMIKVFPVSLSFLLNVMTGVYGLSFVNIPMFFCLRRLCTVFIYSYDIFILKQPVIILELVSICFICSGTIIAGLNDLTFDVTGYVLVLANNMLTTLNLQLSKQVSKDNPEIGPSVQTYYNAVISIPILLIISLGTNDLEVLFNVEKTSGFLLSLSISSILGILLTFSQALCTILLSPMATSITGNVKDILGTFVGLFAFGDVILSINLIAGLIVSLTGAMIYSYSKIAQKNKQVQNKMKQRTRTIGYIRSGRVSQYKNSPNVVVNNKRSGFIEENFGQSAQRYIRQTNYVQDEDRSSPIKRTYTLDSQLPSNRGDATPGRTVYRRVNRRKCPSYENLENIASGSPKKVIRRTRSKSSKRKNGEFPQTPQNILRDYGKQLTHYERDEILWFKSIYFLGLEAAKKNNFYSDKTGNYEIVIGDHLRYRYEIIELLGRGSFGKVVKCLDHKTQNHYAVKIMKKSKQKDINLEIEILKKLA